MASQHHWSAGPAHAKLQGKSNRISFGQAENTYQVMFGAWLAKRAQARCVIDLYDNFEAFGASRLPFVLSSFRQAVKQADGVTCFSERLARHVVRTYPPRAKPTTVMRKKYRGCIGTSWIYGISRNVGDNSTFLKAQG